MDDEAFMNMDEFSVGQFLDARVLLIDRAAKVARLTCAEHLLDLTAVSYTHLTLPTIYSV